MGHSILISGVATPVVAALAGLCTAKMCKHWGMGEDEKAGMTNVVTTIACVATSYTINFLLTDPVGAGVTTAAAVTGGIVANAVKTA